MLSRTWRCLNPQCGKAFHSYERGNPPCDHCGCVKVAWIPGGGHIGKVSPGYDRTLKSLARDYGMTNINSPSASRLNRSMPKFDAPRADMPAMHFAPGFSVPYSTNGATCQESQTANQVSGKVLVGRALPASHTVPGPQAFTQVAGRHSGTGGQP